MARTGLIAAAAVFLVAGCSDAGQYEPEASQDAGSPEVSPTAAPGVAFRYSYDFQLADEAISTIQETHAARCEALGSLRCRITGLRYSVREDQAITAMLEVKLAPAIARQFGKQAERDVAGADGKLLNSEFTGEDVGPITVDAGRRSSSITQRIAVLERQLETTRASEERAQLQAQLNQLRTELANAQSEIDTAADKLATTPMTFNYYGRGGLAGFAGDPVRDAGRSFVGSLVAMITFLLQAIAVLLPWALLIALIVGVARSRVGRGLRRFLSARATPSPDEPAEERVR